MLFQERERMPPSQPAGYLPRELGAYPCFTILAHLSAPFHEALHPVPRSHIHLLTNSCLWPYTFLYACCTLYTLWECLRGIILLAVRDQETHWSVLLETGYIHCWCGYSISEKKGSLVELRCHTAWGAALAVLAMEVQNAELVRKSV